LSSVWTLRACMTAPRPTPTQSKTSIGKVVAIGCRKAAEESEGARGRERGG
jgi:hypothetical protein